MAGKWKVNLEQSKVKATKEIKTFPVSKIFSGQVSIAFKSGFLVSFIHKISFRVNDRSIPKF